jgi:hypothetical protein
MQKPGQLKHPAFAFMSIWLQRDKRMHRLSPKGYFFLRAASTQVVSIASRAIIPKSINSTVLLNSRNI